MEELPKKVSIVYILKILEETSENMPLKEGVIADMVSKCGITCDEKAVKRDIQCLIQMKCPIKKTERGFFYDHSEFWQWFPAVKLGRGKKREKKDLKTFLED